MLMTTVPIAAIFGAIAAMLRNGKNPMLPVVALEVLYPSPDANKPNAVKKSAASQSWLLGGAVLAATPIVATVAIRATVATTVLVDTLRANIRK